MTLRERKDSDSSDSRKTFIIFMVGLVLSILLDFFFPFFAPTSVVVVDFIGTMKSN